MIDILVVDDHAVVRRGIVQIVAETSDMRCTGEAASGSEALSLVRTCNYDVIILDIHLPDSNGLELLKQIKSFKPTIPILILTMYPEQQYAIRAFKAGALGYLTKESVPDELVIALRKVAYNQPYVSASLAGILATHLGQHIEQKAHEELSDREDQVLRLLAAGKTASQIASTLSLSVKTVSTYRSRILKKLKLHTTAELIRYALDHGLLL